MIKHSPPGHDARTFQIPVLDGLEAHVIDAPQVGRVCFLLPKGSLALPSRPLAEREAAPMPDDQQRKWKPYPVHTRVLRVEIEAPGLGSTVSDNLWSSVAAKSAEELDLRLQPQAAASGAPRADGKAAAASLPCIVVVPPDTKWSSRYQDLSRVSREAFVPTVDAVALVRPFSLWPVDQASSSPGACRPVEPEPAPKDAGCCVIS